MRYDEFEPDLPVTIIANPPRGWGGVDTLDFIGTSGFLKSRTVLDRNYIRAESECFSVRVKSGNGDAALYWLPCGIFAPEGIEFDFGGFVSMIGGG